VVSADQASQFFFARKDTGTGIAGRFARDVDSDVVFCIDRKSFHLVLSSHGLP
jgi:hypothetical protein